ncbi:MAG TPA: hypothetical protein VIM30_05415 [Candidatus Limnocylindrales bacterium]|jgi:hypothetical protein
MRPFSSSRLRVVGASLVLGLMSAWTIVATVLAGGGGGSYPK